LDGYNSGLIISTLTTCEVKNTRIFFITLSTITVGDEIMNSESGSDPQLHTGGNSYCNGPVVLAEFSPSAITSSPPVTIYLLIIEVADRVYGQILSQTGFRQFEELPHTGPDTVEASRQLEFESIDGCDSLSTLWRTISGLESFSNESGFETLILDSIDVMDENYVEAGVALVQEYGTPGSELNDFISKSSVLGVESEVNQMSSQSESEATPF